MAATIRNIPPSPHLAPAAASSAGIAAAIKMGVADMGWSVVAESAGLIQARLDIRTHMALVTIGFDESNYWIDYQDSSNLGYSASDSVKHRGHRKIVVKGPRIHQNYNLWIGNLAASIEARTRALIGTRSR